MNKLWYDCAGLFDLELETLRERGCPSSIVVLLHRQRSSVVEQASKMAVRAELIPFIPVVPLTYSTAHNQMTMVRNGDKKGYASLEPTIIRDLIKTPREPYFIFNVEDGETALGKNQENVARALRKAMRSYLTVAETIALCTHTDALSHRSVATLNSRYGKWWSHDTLTISIDRNGRPALNLMSAKYSSKDEIAIPSCGSRQIWSFTLL